MSETVRAVVGLGANVGDAAATLRDAIRALADEGIGEVAGVSDLYVTAPVGVTNQADFHNAVVLLDTAAGPTPGDGALMLLVRLKGLERVFGRRRRRRWGPREVDLDIEAFGDSSIAVERPPEGQSLDVAVKGVRLLVVPHAESRTRLFVLAPWADVAPDQRPPGWGETVASARDRIAASAAPDAIRRVASWDATRRDWAPVGNPRDEPRPRTT